MSTVIQLKGNYGRAGGPETLIASLVASLDRRCYEPVTVLLNRPGVPVADALLPVRARPGWYEVPWRGLLAARSASAALDRIAKSLSADLLHSHDMRSNLVAYLLRRTRRIAWIAHVHGWLGHTHAGRWRVYEQIDRFLVRHADLVLVGSQSALAEVEAAGARRCRLVRNCVDVPDRDALASRSLAVRERLQIAADSVVTGVIGRVHGGKGQRVFIEALRKCAAAGRLHGMIVGEGPELESLRNEVEADPPPCPVSFTGFQEDGMAHLGAMDICVVPSLKESLPLTCLEAMALGRPVIASRVGDLPEAVQEGETGLLVSPGDATALADAIACMAEDPALRARMGARARERVVQRYSAASMAREIEFVYGEVLRHGGSNA